jgi:hypothetical protein
MERDTDLERGAIYCIVRAEHLKHKGHKGPRRFHEASHF